MTLHVAVAAVLLPGLLLFYGNFYSVHQDLAGSALSGKLSVTLGDAFRSYSLYFPPAERAWFSLAVRLSDLTGIRLDLAVVLMTGLAVLFAAGLAYRIRRDTVGASPWFLVLSVAVLTVLPILYKNVFGLREHMVALGVWPYLVLRAAGHNGTRIGRGTRLLLGLWLGATLLFKYLYSIVVFLVEVADAVAQRRHQLLLRIENVAAGGVVVLYMFGWLVIDSSQREAIGAVKSAIDANLAEPWVNWVRLGLNIYFAVFVLLAFRVGRLSARLAAIGLALVVGSIAVAWIQQRWYSHHMFAISTAYVAWWWLAGRGFKWWGHLAMAIYLAVPIAQEFLQTAPYQRAVSELETTLDQSGRSLAGKRVGILTMHPSPYNQVLASRGATRWNASMNNSYVASELRPFDKPENAKLPPPPVVLQDRGRGMLHDEMLRLWEDMPPDVLILDHSTRWPLRYLDVEWTHVFSKDQRFQAVLRRYRPVVVHKGKELEFKYLERID